MRFSTAFTCALSATVAIAGPVFNATSPYAAATTGNVVKRDIDLKNYTSGMLSRVRSALHLNTTLSRRMDNITETMNRRSLNVTLFGRADNSTKHASMPMRRAANSTAKATSSMSMPMRRSVVPVHNSTSMLKRASWSNKTAAYPSIARRSIHLNATAPSNVTLAARSIHVNSTVLLNSTASALHALREKVFHKRAYFRNSTTSWNSTRA